MFFAGGRTAAGASSAVDIYDASTGNWLTPMQLPVARDSLTAVAIGRRVFFAGGVTSSGDLSNVVNVYDTLTQIFTSLVLSEARCNLVAVTYGSRVYFAGGRNATGYSTKVDVYDTGVGWLLSLNLPTPRSSFAGGRAGRFLVFGGGALPSSNNFPDVLKADSQVWSSYPTSIFNRTKMAAVSAGRKIVFAGGLVDGMGASDISNVFDSATQLAAQGNIPDKRFDLAGGLLGDYIYFAGGTFSPGITLPGGKRSSLILYNTNNGAFTYSTQALSQARSNLAAAAAGNRILFAGGLATNDVLSDVVDIFDCQPADFTITGTGERCMGSPFPIGLSGSQPGVTYRLYRYSTLVGTFPGTGAAISAGNFPSPGTYSFVATGPTGCTRTMSGNGTATWKPTPDVSASPLSQTICSGEAIDSIVFSGSITGTSYYWVRINPAAATGIAGSGYGTIKGALTTTSNTLVNVEIEITPQFDGCVGLPITATIAVKPVPQVTPVYASSICSGATDSVRLLSTVAGTSFTWNATQSGNVSGVVQSGNSALISHTLTVPGFSAGTVTYLINSVYSGCAGATAVATVLVNPRPSVSAVNATPSICTGDSTHIALSGTGNVYTWKMASVPDPAAVSGDSSGSGTSITRRLVSADTMANRSVRYIVTPSSNGCVGKADTTYVAVRPNNRIQLATPDPGVRNQSICVNTPLTPVTFTTTGATGANVTYPPASGIQNTVWNNNTIELSGIPTTSSVIPITIALTGGCGQVSDAVSVTVNPNARIALLSASSSNSQSICSGSPITEIRYAMQNDTERLYPIWPVQFTRSWPSDSILKITSGPLPAGYYPYKIIVRGRCGADTVSGGVTVVNNRTVALLSGPGSDSQAVCRATAISPIIYVTAGVTGIDTIYDLPPGATWTFANNIVTIGGTPTGSAHGGYHYQIVPKAGCGANPVVFGYIGIVETKSIALSSDTGTKNQSVCFGTSIKDIVYTTSGSAEGEIDFFPENSGLSHSRVANKVIISGKPTVTGEIKYVVRLTEGCGPPVSDSGIVKVVEMNSIKLVSPLGGEDPIVCLGDSIPAMVFRIAGAPDADTSGLPPGLSSAMSGNLYTISGVPRLPQVYHYTITTKGGCSKPDVAQGTITVKAHPAATIAGLAPMKDTICLGTENLTLSAQFADSVRYHWSVDPAGVLIKSGAGLNTALSFLTPGVYTVKLVATDSFKCADSASQRIVVSSEQGIRTRDIFLKRPGDVLVYPDNKIERYQWGYDLFNADQLGYDRGHELPAQVYQFFPVTDSEHRASLDTAVHLPKYAFWVQLRDRGCESKVYYNGPFARRSAAQPPIADNSLRLQIVPNPNGGSFSLLLDGNIYGDVNAIVYNSLGQAVHRLYFTKRAESSKLQVSLDFLPAGVYYVQVSSSDLKKINARFVIQP